MSSSQMRNDLGSLSHHQSRLAVYLVFLMSLQKIKVLCWNVRGLGSVQKCNVVRSTLVASRCEVCIFQETKLNEIDLNYFSLFLPSFFVRMCACNKAINNAGGCLIAWKRSYELINCWSTKHTISVLLKQSKTGVSFVVTNVYGPSEDNLKLNFLEELKSLHALVCHPWIIGGDFNMVRWLVDRSGDMRGINLMCAFNDVIRELALMDVPLKNRTFTWSSKRPRPVFSKLDRIFLSPDWASEFPVITLEAMEMAVSDHVPLLLTCKHLQTQKRHSRLELFWLKYPQAKAIIHDIWLGEGAASSLEGVPTFLHRTKKMHQELRIWHGSNFGVMETQLIWCKKVILFMDQIEERRDLQPHEFRFRNKIREKCYELANNVELKWKQRSRCKWLSEGDKNTRFFHAYASARLRKNMIASLDHEGVRVTEPIQIQIIFLDHMKSVLGEQSEVANFDPTAIYAPNQDLNSLQDPFTEIEIERAICRLARHKASGPDGLPNEFLQNHWPDVKETVLSIIHGFYDHSVDLQQLNRANLIMIPKVDEACKVEQFRPISVINLIPKLISKILADRLRVFLPDLISPNQTAFVKGRQISENFIATREILHHIAEGTKPAVFVKIDFAKAFDSVNWSFLLRVLRARGFPERWVVWIKNLLQTATSSVVVNGQGSVFFPHKQGLRQGDPLSPMLFDLAVDVLQRMIGVVNSMVQSPISNTITESIIAMQYADDTAIVAGANTRTLVTLKLTLRLFTSISGLRINYSKSRFVPINVHEEDMVLVSQLLTCNQASFPIQYLGMPLMVTNPGRTQFLPLIEKLEKKLAGWKGKLISRGGRLQLVNSVLSSIPIYHMACFRIPKWAIERIDKIRRTFLWGKSDGNTNGISLLNWEMVCLPTRWGGMGVADLQIRNISLMLRWWWRLYHEPDSLWAMVATRIRGTGIYANGPRLWSVRGSFFWRQLGKIKHYFNWSLEWIVGDGSAISFWFDPWNGAPMIDQMPPGHRPTSPSCSLRDAALIMHILAPEVEVTNTLTFSNCRDELRWRWTSAGVYTSKSAYEMIIGGGMIKWSCHRIWKYKIPATVKIFTYHLFLDKILTHEVMIRRRIRVSPGCVMCNNCPAESALHLLFLCPYAVAMWMALANLTGQSFMTPEMSVQQIWRKAWHTFRSQSPLRATHRVWETRFAAAVWLLWKQRNRVVFGGPRKPPAMLAEDIMVESNLWLQCMT